MKSYFALLISVCLLAVPLYPGISMAQDVHSQVASVGPGVERRWSDLRQAMNVPSEEREAPIGYGVDVEELRELKRQPFARFEDSGPVIEEDSDTLGPQPLAPTILTNFEGPDNVQPDGIFRPPDPHLAVGLNHVGVMVNCELAFYTKTGTLVFESGFSDWWSNVYSGAEIPFDPRIAYDHHANRWLMMALVKDYPDSWYLLSVSQTSDPTGAWWNYKLDATLFYGGTTWADYPDLGFDGITDGAIYITSNQFTFAAGIFRTAMLNILPKSALYSGAGFEYWRAWDRTNEDGSQVFTLRAAHTFGNPGVEFLINSKSGGWDKVTLWKVVPTFSPTEVDWTRQATITIGGYSPPPDAQQKGGNATLDTIDNRIYNCMYRNGYLYAAFTEAYDWGSGPVAAIRYLKIDTSTNSADLNVRYGADGYYYWFPAIYTDNSDNIVIVFARSSATEYAGIRYTGHKSTDSFPQPSALLKAGETYITGDRWGDYFGIGNDPSDGSKVWIYGEWAKDCPRVDSVWDWGTWVGEVSFAIHDVNVTDVNITKTVVGQGFSMDINVTVTNEGDLTETFNVTAYYNETAITLPNGKNYRTITLTSGNSTTVTFTWNTTEVAFNNYTISATAELPPPIIDIDPTDNSYIDGFVIVSLPGDINGDGIVNVVDLSELGKAYHSTPSTPNWNPEADIDNDLIINTFDLTIIDENYGKTI